MSGENEVLGYDCDENPIKEYMILKAIWSNDMPIEELKHADAREYCAVVADDGKAYAVSVYDEKSQDLIREREHIPEYEEIPTIIRSIKEMGNYELSIDHGKGEYETYKYDKSELKQRLNIMLKMSPHNIKTIEEINLEIIELKKNGQSVKEISDGHHTFEDYIDMRNRLYIALCEAHYDKSWKSRRHYDEENDPMFNDDFIAGINTPKGVITFHLKMKYWDELNVCEIYNAPKYDGYTEEDVKERIKSLYRRN